MDPSFPVRCGSNVAFAVYTGVAVIAETSAQMVQTRTTEAKIYLFRHTARTKPKTLINFVPSVLPVKTTLD